jgi:hypothetical protein
MTATVKSFFLRKVDRGLETAIAFLFLGAMAGAGWTIAGLI